MKNLVLTGATRGLGLNHALYLSKENYNLAIIDISEEASNVYGEMSSVKKLIERLSELSRNHFSGIVTISFYKGSLSKKVKLEVTESLKLDDSLTEIDGTNGKPKP